MSKRKATPRERVEGHPGIYSVGGSYQARYRDRTTGTVVSRNFSTLEDAVAHKAKQLGFVYQVWTYVGGESVDHRSVAATWDDVTIAGWPEMREYIEAQREAGNLDWTSEGTRAGLRREALLIALGQEARHGLEFLVSDVGAFDGVVDGQARTASVTLKIRRVRADDEANAQAALFTEMREMWEARR